MTEFEQRVYNAVKNIPCGAVKTYSDIACATGNPRAARAVGNALNKNRDPRVPCHRVIRSEGKIGGYNRGVAAKTKLLRREGVLAARHRPKLSFGGKKISLGRSRF